MMFLKQYVTKKKLNIWHKGLFHVLYNIYNVVHWSTHKRQMNKIRLLNTFSLASNDLIHNTGTCTHIICIYFPKEIKCIPYEKYNAWILKSVSFVRTYYVHAYMYIPLTLFFFFLPVKNIMFLRHFLIAYINRGTYR